MTSTAAAYRSPYVSEIIKETDGSLDDCAVCTGIMLVGDWTLGEGLTRPDGRPKDVLGLREWSRARLGRDVAVGGLTLHDMSDLMAFIDPGLPPLPRYSGQRLRTGQKNASPLRLTWDGFVSAIKSDHSGALCGNPVGVRNPSSPLRSVQGSDDYAHVIHVTDGNATGAVVKDPLTRHHAGYPGARVTWDDLRQFTEAKKDGARQFGTPDEIACAVIKVGDQTQAMRVTREAERTVERALAALAAQKAQTKLAIEERDQARRESSGDASAILAKIKELLA